MQLALKMSSLLYKKSAHVAMLSPVVTPTILSIIHKLRYIVQHTHLIKCTKIQIMKHNS